MTTVNASKVVLSPAFCKDNTNITSMDLSNTAFVSNCMHKAFYNCTALNSVTNINSDVVDMSSTFTGCSNLTSVSSLPIRLKTLGGTVYKDTLNIGGAFANTALTAVPTIPSTVTNMLGTFANCTSLVSAGTIPSGVIDMRFCYMNCTNLTTAPTIPSSVKDIRGIYSGCTNLTNGVMIMSKNIACAIDCFYGTSATKNVYIPFYSSGTTYSQTYNAFIAAGYKTDGSKEGVYLKDLSEHDDTPTPEPEPEPEPIVINVAFSCSIRTGGSEVYVSINGNRFLMTETPVSTTITEKQFVVYIGTVSGVGVYSADNCSSISSESGTFTIDGNTYYQKRTFEITDESLTTASCIFITAP